MTVLGHIIAWLEGWFWTRGAPMFAEVGAAVVQHE